MKTHMKKGLITNLLFIPTLCGAMIYGQMAFIKTAEAGLFTPSPHNELKKKDNQKRKEDFEKAALKKNTIKISKKTRNSYTIDCFVHVPVDRSDEVGTYRPTLYQAPLISKHLTASFQRNDKALKKCVYGEQNSLSASVCLNINPKDFSNIGQVEMTLEDKLATKDRGGVVRSIPLNDNKTFKFSPVPVGPKEEDLVVTFSIGESCTFSENKANSDLFISEAQEFGGQAGSLAKDIQPEDEVSDDSEIE